MMTTQHVPLLIANTEKFATFQLILCMPLTYSKLTILPLTTHRSNGCCCLYGMEVPSCDLSPWRPLLATAAWLPEIGRDFGICAATAGWVVTGV